MYLQYKCSSSFIPSFQTESNLPTCRVLGQKFIPTIHIRAPKNGRIPFVSLVGTRRHPKEEKLCVATKERRRGCRIEKNDEHENENDHDLSSLQQDKQISTTAFINLCRNSEGIFFHFCQKEKGKQPTTMQAEQPQAQQQDGVGEQADDGMEVRSSSSSYPFMG